jgi:carbon starvation protein
MPLLAIVLGSAALLFVAYFVYGNFLARLLQLNPNAKMPAQELEDGLDYQPIPARVLLPQHFSAIAAAGPIVGPIVAGLTFGWLPALIWILAGSIFVGGVHDITALVASVRHKARSIAEVVREQMSRSSYLLFLTFIWIALVYIIVAFADVTASSFVGAAKEENGNVPGAAIAGSSFLYLLLPMAMGIAIRYAKAPAGLVTLIALPLVVVAILVGKYVPIDLQGWFKLPTEGDARKVWAAILLVYCLLAGVAPVWLLLQPRGELGGYFLYAALGIGALGLVLGGGTVQYPAFLGFAVTKEGKPTAHLFPMLFIMIACGACSGFHSLIASGTTAKQLKTETDAKPVGYGTMLLEAMVATVSLCCVMMFAPDSTELNGSPNQVYAQGLGRFAAVLGVPAEFAITFALLAFTTFVYDTLDVCTRLGRFIIEELTGLHNWVGRTLGVGLTAGVPLFFLLRHPTTTTTIVDGVAVTAPARPLFETFWNLFGASNQLLAALTLLGVTVWLWNTRRAVWVWFVVGIPTVLMYAMSTWALANMTFPKLLGENRPTFLADPVPYVGLVLLGLAAAMLVEAVRVLFFSAPAPPRAPQAALKPTA